MRKFFILFLLLTGLRSYAQESDFQSWWAVELYGELFNEIDFEITPEIRFAENSIYMGRALTELNLSYPVTKFFRLGALYRYELQRNTDRYSNITHRFAGYVQFQVKIKRLRISYRPMFQQEYTDYNASEMGHVPNRQFRQKLTLKYRPKGWDFTPFLASEGYHTLFPLDKKGETKIRLSAGTRYKINKKMALSLSYKLQREYFENNPLTSSIITVKYIFSL